MVIHTPDGTLSPGQVGYWLHPDLDAGSVLTVTLQAVARDMTVPFAERMVAVLDGQAYGVFTLSLAQLNGRCVCLSDLYATADGAHQERMERAAKAMMPLHARLLKLREAVGAPSDNPA